MDGLFMRRLDQKDAPTDWPQIENIQSTDCRPSEETQVYLVSHFPITTETKTSETLLYTMKHLNKSTQMHTQQHQHQHQHSSDLAISPRSRVWRGSLLLASYLFSAALATAVQQATASHQLHYTAPTTQLFHRMGSQHPQASTNTNLLSATPSDDQNFSESNQDNLELDQVEPIEAALGAAGSDQLLMNQRHHHQSRLRAVRNILERRHLASQQQLQASQELSPMSIGLDSGAGPPFGVGPFAVPNHDVVGPPIVPKAVAMSNADNIDPNQLPFALNPLPHLLGFQGSPFEAALQRGDQSVNSHHQIMEPTSESGNSEQLQQSKSWPKIFRFTDGRINLSEFEKQKKIRLSNKNQHNGDNHIESAPIMFDGRPLKRKTFLILHGGIFPAR